MGEPERSAMERWADRLAEPEVLRPELPTEGLSGVTVLDIQPHNALIFSQGSWRLIATDLLASGLPPAELERLETHVAGPAIAAFETRRELVNFKKVCLHLFAEGRRLEDELKQHVAYFFYQAEEQSEDMVAQLAVSFESEDEAMKLAAHVEASADTGAVPRDLVHRKRMYYIATRALMRHRGTLRAIHDARDVLKSICMTPRHPEGPRPRRLRELPKSLYVDQAVVSASVANPSLGRKASKASGKSTDEEKSQQPVQVISDEVTDSDDAEIAAVQLCASRDALDKILAKARTVLHWTPAAVNFLEKSLVARGAFKALAMVAELNIYRKHLDALVPKLQTTIQRFEEADAAAAAAWASHSRAGGTARQAEEWLSASVLRNKHLQLLSGALDVTLEHVRWIAQLDDRARAAAEFVPVCNPEDAGACSALDYNPHSRMFVAGDDVRKQTSCAYVPRDFKLGAMSTFARGVLTNLLQPAMATSLEAEGWPPHQQTRRTRVGVYGDAQLALAMERGAKHVCSDCHGRFTNIWMRQATKQALCTVCEKRRRTAAGFCTQCPLACRLAKEAWCPHASRCFCCDAPHTCDKCRLSRGDGETVQAAAQQIRPKHLCLDFDRTLCSTKRGASPLPPGGRVQHTIDPDLKAAAAVHDSVHIITRNSHRDDIIEFLGQQGLPNVQVHTVPKKQTKGAFIRELFFEGTEEGSDGSTEGLQASCIFVDDDIRELVIDPWLRCEQRIHRVLFVRGL